MPSASAKLEKQASLEGLEPIKQALSLLEKKVRNLEKRKGKLDTYKQEVSQGKELNDDQKNAIGRYDELLSLLELSKELHKAISEISDKSVVSLKKQAKKEQAERKAHEIQRLKEVLKVQDVLSGMGDESTREDFLNGRNGALLLTEQNLDQLDKLYKLITPSREPEESVENFDAQLGTSADHIVSLLEGKNKEVLGSNYKELKEMILKIHECDYFNAPENSEVTAVNGDEETQPFESDYVEAPEDERVEVPQEEAELGSENLVQDVIQSSSTVRSQDDIPTVTPAEMSLAGSGSSSSVPQQDDSIFSTFTHNRPYTEVISDSQSSFHFLQESQIDMEPSHIDPAVVAAHPLVSQRPYVNPQATDPAIAYQSVVAPHEQDIVTARGAGSPVGVAQQTAQYVQPVATIPPHPTPDFSQIPSQTFTNQTYVTLQTFPPATVYGQVPPPPQPQPVSQSVSVPNTAAVVAAAVASSAQMGMMISNDPQSAAAIPEQQKKQHFMNVNATEFESTIPYNVQQHPPPMRGGSPVEVQGDEHGNLESSNVIEQNHNSGKDDSQAGGGAPGGYPHSSSYRGGYGRGGRGSSRGNNRGIGGGTANGYGNRRPAPGGGYSNSRNPNNFQGSSTGANNYYGNYQQRDNFSGQTYNNSGGYKARGGSRGAGGNRGVPGNYGGGMPRGGNSRGGGYSGKSVAA